MAKKDIVLQIGCKVEVLNSWFAINQLENTPLVFSFTKENVPNKVLSVREATRLLSVGTGKSVLKCGCLTGTCLGKRRYIKQK